MRSSLIAFALLLSTALHPGGVAAEPAAPPHATLSPADLATLRTAAAAAAEDPAHDPRTALFDAAGAPRFVNRLVLEASPYLRQHAHNPVDWRPWSEETLAEARRLDRPIFLSVGYAACHWCHVMEAESFDTLVVAEALNRAFVPVKVDREALPAIDAAYMRATELIAGAGGWPNTVWLTPEGAPFFARTYLPQADLLSALDAISAGWAEDPAGLRGLAAKVVSALDQAAAQESAGAAAVDAGIRAAAAETLLARHNDLTGGFGETAQFPLTPWLRFLLDHWRRAGDAAALDAVTLTLDEIVAGGMHDHVGGGFHRYTVDPGWAQPHFEKMLYNQAQLARLLIEAWEATGRAPYRRAAERALDYVRRDMTAPEGGFYAAEDADSARHPGGARIEGAFYAWSAADLQAALGPETAPAVATALSLDAPPLIEAGPTPRAHADALATLPTLDPALDRLRRAREARPRPLRDEKIIAGWNGLMIAALADASAALDRPQDRVIALAAAEAVWTRLWRPPADGAPHGQLMRFMSGGRVDPTPGALTDYAWTALGFIALADAGADPVWSERAVDLAEAAMARFGAGDGRLALSETATPLGRLLEQEDGTTPSGESALIEAFALLARREQGLMAEDKAHALLAGLTPALTAAPADRVTALAAGAILADGESGNRRAMARGVVRVSARRSGADLAVRLAIAPGWHVNAHQPHDDMLIATALDGANVVEPVYPTPHDVRLGFSDAPLSVIEGGAEIRARVADGADAAPLAVALTLQACSTDICLEPERALFRFAPAERD